MIVVQHITTRWTKASRGMPGAAKRNAVPDTFAILPIDSSPHELLVHGCMADEANQFELNQSADYLEQYNSYQDLSFRRNNNKVDVYFSYSMSKHGAPKRGERRLFNLAPGEWGMFHINGRFTSYRGQWYKQQCFNIANCDVVSPNLFRTTTPNYFVDKKADLF